MAEMCRLGAPAATLQSARAASYMGQERPAGRQNKDP
jgi:hypothetical protein